MRRTDLSGKCAIVTGGGSGIGRAIAAELAEQGARVVLTGRRSEPLQKSANTIEDAGGEAIWLSADVSREEDVERIVAAAMSAYGQVGILVNNAGISGSGAIHDHDVTVWDKVMSVNLRGPFLLCRAVLPIMRAQRDGHIVNISSESGLEYYPGNGAYGVSKHALNALGEYVQRENQDYGIRVDTICPGMVVTPMSEGSVGLDRDKCLFPEDIAELTVWLLTRRSNVKIGRPVLIQTMENPWSS
ncbi:MAG: SDR family oxidoreductase [Chloroflexota bacterium]|jgi:NAD(P)-dependent dehydrogenase (short-subunit alcohol dehydrogenase family)